LSSALNLADWLFVFYFVSTGGLILARHRHIRRASVLVALHAFAVALIVLLAALSHRSSTLRFLHDWYPLVLPIVTFEEVALLSRHVRPGWRDDFFIKLEIRLFPVAPTVWLGKRASWWLTEILQSGYFSYFVLLIIVGGALYARADKAPFYGVMAASTLSYLLCYVIFIVFPTQGPAHTLAALHTEPLPGGPFHALVNFIQRHAGVHGNAFPSSHVAAAVVAVFYAWRYAPELGALLTPFLVLLCVAAVYDRYHYVSDVVGGIVVGLVAIGLIWKFSTAFTR
jgi:membrane-associated phospholipid phosphatase